MTQTELIRTIAEETDISQKTVKVILDQFQETVINTTMNDNDFVALASLGRFKKKTSNARIGLNPQTKAKVSIPASETICFKPIKSLKTII